MIKGQTDAAALCHPGFVLSEIVSPDGSAQRRESAHERAAAMHEVAAQVHAQAAEFFERVGFEEAAQRERKAAETELERARLDRADADADAHQIRFVPLLKEIEGRLRGYQARREELAERTSEMYDRRRNGSSVALDGLHQLQRDLDTALDEIAGLRTAMQTRGVIEQAKGMLMLLLHVDEEAAFQLLVKRSQSSHRKLVDVSRDVVESGRLGEFAASG